MPRDDRTVTDEDVTPEDGARLPDFDVDDAAASDAPEDGAATLSDDDLHRPEELDGETVACTITETEAEKRAAWIRSEMVPHLEAVMRRESDTDPGEDPTDEGALGGYTLVFAEEALEAVMRFARHEHWCCSFAHFEVHVTPGEDPNELTVYGPEGADEMFGAEFVDRMAEAAGVPAPT